MTNKHKKKIKYENSNSMDREIKWCVGLILIAFAIVGTIPYFQDAPPVRYLDGVIQYVDAAEFYVTPDEVHMVQHNGTGSSCPTATGPSSATLDTNTFDVPLAQFFGQLFDDADDRGCQYSVWAWDEESIFPDYFNDLINSTNNSIWWALDWGNNAWNGADNAGNGLGCDWISLDGKQDARINATDVYQAIRFGTELHNNFNACDRNVDEFQEIIRGSTVVEANIKNDFTGRTNNTFYQLGGREGTQASSRDAGSDRDVDLALSEFSMKVVIPIPANHSNGWWQMQEHAMFISTGSTFQDNNPPLIDSGFFGIDDVTFTMDTGLDAVERGQVVLFKQFNKTALGEVDFRVKGGIQSVSALGDTKLKIEVRDAGIQAGQSQFTSTEGNEEAGGTDGLDYFHHNEPIRFFNNGSLGTIDFEPTSLGAVEGFDISISPEWTHSTNEIITLIIAVQDNSTTGSLIANVTSVEADSIVRYDFTDINVIKFWEDDCNTTRMATDDSAAEFVNDENCGLDMSNGLIEVNTIATEGVSGTLVTPNAVTGLTVGVITDDSVILRWNHDLLDTTGFRIERADGSGSPLVEYIENTAVRAEVGFDGTLKNEFIDINYFNSTVYPSKANAHGLEENTVYSYRVCALNGDLIGTCSSTVSVKTPDDLNFWQLVEASMESGFPTGSQFRLNGGDGDWFVSTTGTGTRGGLGTSIIKSFNVTELQLKENNSFPRAYYDWDLATGTTTDQFQMRFYDGKFNRFNTTAYFPNSNFGQINSQLIDALALNDLFGALSVHQPHMVEATIDLNQVKSDFITVVMTVDDDSPVVSYQWHIKNFTWVNSTSWEFEAANGSNLNFTQRINVDDENLQGGTYTNPGFSNCKAGSPTVLGKYIDHTFDCDQGTLYTPSTSQTIFRTTEDVNDWQFREYHGIGFFSFATINAGVNGIEMESFDAPTNNNPQEFTEFAIFKTFDKSVLSQPISIYWEGDNTVNIPQGQLSIINGTIDRWNSTQFSFDGSLISTKSENVNVFLHSFPFGPFLNTTLYNQTSNPTTDDITVYIRLADNSQSETGRLTIQNVTVGSKTYDFTTNSTLVFEVGSTNTEDGVGGDMGLITPGSVIVPPPPKVTGLTGETVFATVSLDWDTLVEADNYVVLRNDTSVGTPTSSDFIDTTVSPGTFYNFTVYGTNTGGDGLASSIFLTTNDVPSPPINLTVAMGQNVPFLETAILNWTVPSFLGEGTNSTGLSIVNYTVDRKQGLGSFSFLGNSTTESFLDDTQIAGGNYTWRVKAINEVGESAYSNTFSLITTPLTPPDDPTNLTAVAVSGSQIDLEWDDLISGDSPTGYRIQQRHVGFTGFVTIVSNTGNLNQFYNVTGLLPGNTYDYRVAGINGAGQSGYTNIAQATTFTVPTVPLNLKANTINTTSIFINWDEPTITYGGIQNYTIQSETPIGAGFTTITTVNGNITELTVTGLTTKTQYNFRVSATNEIGTGGFSNQAANTTYGVPDAPINLAFTTNGISVITVTWDAPVLSFSPGGVTNYVIEQAEGVGGTFVTATPNHPATPRSKTYSGLLQQTNYIYHIAAKNSFGTGPFSANLTAGTFLGPSEPENFFALFNATKPYSVFLSWEEPLSDGGKAISGYLVQRKNVLGIYEQIANLTSTARNYTDTNLLNLATHTYRIAAYSNPTGSFTPDEPVTTVVSPNFVNFTITDFKVVADVLRQDYSFIIDDCFPTCTLTQADIKRNGIVESNYAVGQAITLDTPVTFTTYFILPNTALNSINTTAIVTNLGTQGDDEAGVTLATAEFLVPTSLFFNHTRTNDFQFVNFTLVRHPVPWDATCEYQNGAGFGFDTAPFGQAGIQPTISLQKVGFYNDLLDVLPSLNTYVACFDPADTQILSFTSFGFGNGSQALISFTSQLGDFMGVPIPFIFIIFLAAIWTGRSASTGIIFLSVAIGTMGVLGYFPGLDDQPLLAGTFWSLIVLLTVLGVLVGKRFF